MSDAQDALRERIDALEMRLTYQDVTIETLNQTITAQWAEIDKLTRQLNELKGAGARGRKQCGRPIERTAPALLNSRQENATPMEAAFKRSNIGGQALASAAHREPDRRGHHHSNDHGPYHRRDLLATAASRQLLAEWLNSVFIASPVGPIDVSEIRRGSLSHSDSLWLPSSLDGTGCAALTGSEAGK